MAGYKAAAKNEKEAKFKLKKSKKIMLKLLHTLPDKDFFICIIFYFEGQRTL